MGFVTSISIIHTKAISFSSVAQITSAAERAAGVLDVAAHPLCSQGAIHGIRAPRACGTWIYAGPPRVSPLIKAWDGLSIRLSNVPGKESA